MKSLKFLVLLLAVLLSQTSGKKIYKAYNIDLKNEGKVENYVVLMSPYAPDSNCKDLFWISNPSDVVKEAAKAQKRVSDGDFNIDNKPQKVETVPGLYEAAVMGTDCTGFTGRRHHLRYLKKARRSRLRH
jgi:hypothetical protein